MSKEMNDSVIGRPENNPFANDKQSRSQIISIDSAQEIAKYMDGFRIVFINCDTCELGFLKVYNYLEVNSSVW
jgi:hypothetical protein